MRKIKDVVKGVRDFVIAYPMAFRGFLVLVYVGVLTGIQAPTFFPMSYAGMREASIPRSELGRCSPSPEGFRESSGSPLNSKLNHNHRKPWERPPHLASHCVRPVRPCGSLHLQPGALQLWVGDPARLRHAVATRMAEQRFSPAEIAGHLGHADGAVLEEAGPLGPRPLPWVSAAGLGKVSMASPGTVMLSDEKIRHLDFIQLTITRMAANSFLLKGWAVTLTAGLFAVSAGANKPEVLSYAAIPVLVFWTLDGFYLDQERAYRKLYDKVRDPDHPADFSLDASGLTGPHGWRSACLSKTLLWFYGLIAGTIVALRLIA